MSFIFTIEEEKRFWENVTKTYLKDGSEWCWLWNGPKNTVGYGMFSNASNTGFAHRFSFQLHGKQIPEKWVVNHKCENRQCVNPKHLNTMTQKKNMSLRGVKQSINDKDQINQILLNVLPITRLQECIRGLEDNFWEVGNTKFKEYGEHIPQKTIVEMLSIMIQNKFIIFSDVRNSGREELLDGYKIKYFWGLFEFLFLFYKDVELQSIFNHYRKLLIISGLNKIQLDNRIEDFIEYYKDVIVLHDPYND